MPNIGYGTSGGNVIDFASITQRNQALKQEKAQNQMANLQAIVNVLLKKKELEAQQKQEKQKLLFDLYTKGSPTTVTMPGQDGQPITYTYQSSLSPEVSKKIEAELFGGLGLDMQQNTVQPQSNIQQQELVLPQIGNNGQQVNIPNTQTPMGQPGALENTYQQLQQQQFPMSLKGITGKNASFGTSPVSQEYMKSKMQVATEAAKEEAKRKAGAEGTLTGTDRFLKQFSRSYNELKTKFPEIGDTGLSGFMTRKGAAISNYFDELPETKAFTVRLKVIANQMMRDMEGGKVTDNDRKIAADSFANALQHPSATNIRLASEALLDLKSKGADISKVVARLATSDADIIQQIVRQVLEESPDEWEVAE